MAQVAPNGNLNVVTVEGLEPLFEPLSETITATSADTHTDTSAIDVTVTGTVTGWTLKTASEKLGVSPNTIRKRIKDEELRACKVAGSNGPEWCITPPLDTLTATTANTHTDAATVPNTPAIEALLRVIETQAKQLDAASEQVKAASQVIMYQRSQMEERDTQIKLLTDSQHKPSWWRRFCCWAWSNQSDS